MSSSPGDRPPERRFSVSLPRTSPYARGDAPIPFAQQAAKASWAAPLIALLLGCVSFQIRMDEPVVGIIIGVVNALLIVGGFALAVTALAGVRKHGASGILASAIIGLLINGILIIAMIWLMVRGDLYRQPLTPAQQTVRQRVTTSPVQAGRDAVEKYPGWFGAANLDGAVITITSLADESDAVQDLGTGFSSPISVVSVAINNTRGRQTLRVDPSSLQLRHRDGSITQALATSQAELAAKSDAKPTVRRMSSTQQVPAAGAMTNAMAFLPSGTNWRDVDQVTVQIDGRPLTIVGAFLSVEQKADLLRRGH